MSSSESTLVKIPHCWILTSVDSDGGGGGGGGNIIPASIINGAICPPLVGVGLLSLPDSLR